MSVLRKDITLEDISNMTDENFNLDDFSIDYHEMGCHESETITYIGTETDENIIKLWCLAIATTTDFCHDSICCYMNDDVDFNGLFDIYDELLKEAWELAVKKGLMFEPFGDAIRKLGYIV